MVSTTGLSHLTNPIATATQLQISSSQINGVPEDLERSIKYEGARLIQAAGLLLRLPQDLIAEAIILFYRFWVGPEGGSLLEYGAKVFTPQITRLKEVLTGQDVVAASLYMVTKPSAHPVAPRQLLSVLGYLEKLRPNSDAELIDMNPEQCFLSEGSYQDGRMSLVRTEGQVLRILGYQTHVALPYTLCINYLQALDVFNTSTNGQALSRRAFAHLNTALLSPQLLYLTHQPCALATASIYLAAKETDVKLPADEWWEVFDVDREELGFLVVALTSMTGFAKDEKSRWSRKPVPMMMEQLQSELEVRSMMETGE